MSVRVGIFNIRIAELLPPSFYSTHATKPPGKSVSQQTSSCLESPIDLSVLDPYGDLRENRYFTTRYGSIASTASITVPITDRKGGYATVTGVLQVGDCEVVQREYFVADHSNPEEGDDYIVESLFASPTLPVLVDLSIRSEFANVEFYFEDGNEAAVAWVFAQIDNLRGSLSKERKPVFRVLTKDDNYFRTRNVNIEPTDAELAKNYNDDVVPVDQTIQESIDEKSSGLILLHGPPGTGKTTYIKSLVTRNREEKFIFIPNDFVDEMLKPSFITFLIGQKNSILVIDDA